MAPLSDFERQRQENIQRNKDLLRKLNLDSAKDSISRELPNQKHANGAKKRKTNNATKPIKKEPQEPSRRSRRLAGVTMENTEEYQKMREEMEEAERKKKEIEKLKLTRLFGNFHLIDLVTDKRLGDMKFEKKVLKLPKDIKDEENDTKDIKEEEDDRLEDVDLNIEDDNKVLEILKDLGDKFSAGDFYDLIRNSSVDYDDKGLESKRNEFDRLKLYERFDPLDIKITHQRITAINFHPSKTDRVITAGDKVGNLGIWAVDSTEDEDPAITILKPHGRSVARILTPHSNPSKIYSCAYDGSVRELDLNKLESSEVIYLNDPYESQDYPLAVSDINLCQEGNPNLLYLTTLGGHFYQHDMRTQFKPIKPDSLLRLHDKKIGSFCINPNLSHQIATASLDRTFRIWDLRSTSKSNGSWSEYEGQVSPHVYGSYSSRLSVSSVDWNFENRLVCNGYDDTINIFDLSGEGLKLPPVTEWSKTYQPGPKSKDEQIPNNLKPYTRIKHNCQTGRWVSILKSRWQASPSDGIQKFVIANMNRGLDIYDQKGQILAHLTDSEKVGAVPAVTTMHPIENWCVGGSASGKLYLFE
mmetsp:Transcript_661/g.765  ORF Transcript_661/g.765 Transcript_661/m.765 type:complete len:585 (-) Transcript_661:15-1769(-)